MEQYLKKYGSERAQPHSGRFGKKICTRKFQSTSLDGLHLQPISNDEHSYLVSKMREGFPDLAQPNAEQLLAHEKLQALSEKLHSHRKRQIEDTEPGACSTAVPARKAFKAHCDTRSSRNGEDIAKQCNPSTSSEDLYERGGSRDPGPCDDDEWIRRAIAAGLGRGNSPADGHDNDGTNSNIYDTEHLDVEGLRWKEAYEPNSVLLTTNFEDVFEAMLTADIGAIRRRVTTIVIQDILFETSLEVATHQNPIFYM